MSRAILVLAGMFMLAACGEKPQSMGGIKHDTEAFQGTGMPFAAGGWKQGDKASWEGQLRTRTQNGQNDYTKVN